MARDGEPPASERVQVARIAAEAIDRTEGVTATPHGGGRWQTSGGGQTISGVLASENARGRVDVELHLAAEWPPPASLDELGEQLRDRIRRSAERGGLGERLGAISVAFDDLLTPGESS
ncbi:MAG: hypothetical protein KY463_07055 [Actinobacteria bacterium]|nr:hypothetical protein [Actinomycetota bacterium]